MRSSVGWWSGVSNGIISRLASPGRMASSRASTGACVMNCSISSNSRRLIRRAWPWLFGARITTTLAPLPTWLAEANRVRQDVPATGDGAAQPHQLRAVRRRYKRTPGQIQPPERTSEGIEVGGEVIPAILINPRGRDEDVEESGSDSDAPPFPVVQGWDDANLQSVDRIARLWLSNEFGNGYGDRELRRNTNDPYLT